MAKLVVIIRDPSPMIHFQDSPSYRKVELEFTPEQLEILTLQATTWQNGHSVYEDIAQVFIDYSDGGLPLGPEITPSWRRK